MLRRHGILLMIDHKYRTRNSLKIYVFWLSMFHTKCIPTVSSIVRPKSWQSISEVEQKPGEHIERQFVSNLVMSHHQY